MPLQDELRQFCSSHKLKLNRDLGQHFLIDEEALEAILTAAKITENDHIVEIGPGVGVLTRELLKQAKEVTAIEIDSKLVPLLEAFITNNQQLITNNLSIINDNALHTPMPNTSYKVVANIPYHITSPLLRHLFLESKTTPTSLTLLIQREVTEKICDTQKAGMLTILVGLFGEPTLVKHVPPSSFLPPPKVDSAVLHIDCFAEPKADPQTIEEVFRLTKIAFSQKRKMLRKSLAPFHDVMERLKALGIEETRRPETLSVEEWIAIARSE